MYSLLATTLLSLLSLASAAPLSSSSAPLPVIIWHGLGDKHDNQGLHDVADLLTSFHPGTKVEIIRLDDDGAADQRATFFGNLTTQLSSVCESLSSDPTFSRASGRIDALGFSQGGLFLRGLVETCPGIEVRSLVTFGSPHNGISDLPACGDWDFLCKGAEGVLKANKWAEWTQGNVVPAQYYREVDWEGTRLGSEDYLEFSGWLADVNNERAVKSGAYKRRLKALEHFAMYHFENDTTLLPKETSWFADKNFETGEVVWMRERDLYKQDWIGLKELDQSGALEFRVIKDAGHMQLDDELLENAFRDFYGPERPFWKKLLWDAYRSKIWQSALLGGQTFRL